MVNVAVHVPNRYLSRAVQEHQFEVYNKGWRHGDKSLRHLNSLEPIVINDSGGLYGVYVGETAYEVISVDEYFKRYDKPLPIKIGDSEVEDITEHGFKVGCQFISWGTYEMIGERRPKIKKREG